jgi:glycosyltransferase involved in cell wall biosynthesis
MCPSMEMGVALCFEGRLSRGLDAEGVAIHRLGAVRLRWPASVWRARRALAGALAETPYDVVICHQAWTHAIFGPVAREARTPLVWWLHTVGTGRHWLDRWAARTPPDLAVCNSRFTATVFERQHPGVPVRWVYHPVLDVARAVAPGDRRRVRAGLDTPAGDTVVIQVSRLEPLKGQDVCLDALGRLRDLPGWTCWQIGGPQRAQEARYADRLRASARRLGVEDRVRFAGERDDVPELLGAADIYCQPNTAPEGFGVTFVEALWAGLPVVTTAIGGATEIVDDTCGVLVPPRDAEALAAALRRLIEDGGLRARLGRQARLRPAELCDPATQIGRIHDLLLSVARSSAPAGSPAACGCSGLP